MLEIVAKRAALRPSEASTSLQSEPISLPVLPPQTTINPLLQHPSHRYQSRNVHTFSSQSHNQEHEVSSDDFLFDGTENFYLRSNLSLLHDCEVLFEIYELDYATDLSLEIPRRNLKNNWHFWLLVVEFLVLYIGVLYYSFTRL